jgi:uncharacterized protein YoxC
MGLLDRLGSYIDSYKKSIGEVAQRGTSALGGAFGTVKNLPNTVQRVAAPIQRVEQRIGQRGTQIARQVQQAPQRAVQRVATPIAQREQLAAQRVQQLLSRQSPILRAIQGREYTLKTLFEYQKFTG